MRHSAPRSAALIAFGMLLMALLASRPAAADHVSEWMMMQVCVDADGHVQDGVAPIDPACKARRQIRAGETPPYRLRGWPGRHDGCDTDVAVKWNMPVVKAGVTRIVSVTGRGDNACDDEGQG